MKALILGVTGMLGHQVYLKLKGSGKFSDVKGTMRGKKELLKRYEFFVLDDIYDIGLAHFNKGIYTNPKYINKEE